MWQVDSDAYQLGRLRHESELKSVDRLLNSVTVADRGPPPPASVSRIAALLLAASRRVFKRSRPTHPEAHPVAAAAPHASR